MNKLEMIGVINDEMRPQAVPADGLVPEGWVVKGGFMFPPGSYQLLLWERPALPISWDFGKLESRVAALYRYEVAMPEFDKLYEPSLTRELQAAFEHTCRAVGLEVVYDDAKNLSKNLRTPTGRAMVYEPELHNLLRK